MSKFIMLRGLPASGKSTRAKEIIEKSGNCVRLNKDLLREMLHFDKFSGRNEGLTMDAEKALAREFLLKNINVIIDDTNLGERHKQSWSALAKECNAKFEIVDLDTDYLTCINRNPNRAKPVPPHVILQFAMQYHRYPAPSKPFVICDVDGTLADISHRLHFVKPAATIVVPKPLEAAATEIVGGQFKKDWKSFFEAAMDDAVRIDVASKVKAYQDAGHKVILVSGRPEKYRDITEKWLREKLFAWEDSPTTFETLIMRPNHDKRDDDLVKKDIYEKYLKHYPIEVVIDDRPRVVRMWREQGLKVEDVGHGVEF